MSILDENRNLRKEPQDIKQEIQNLSETCEKLSEELLYSEDDNIFSRIIVLDEWHACVKGAEPHTKRQTLPQSIIAEYNGCVRADIRLTRRYEEGILEHVAKWKDTFEKYYSVSFDSNNDKMESLLWDITRIVDQKANLYGLNKWKVKENEWTSVVVEIVDVILQSWLEWGWGP